MDAKDIMVYIDTGQLYSKCFKQQLVENIRRAVKRAEIKWVFSCNAFVLYQRDKL